jgi:hypothetical protein
MKMAKIKYAMNRDADTLFKLVEIENPEKMGYYAIVITYTQHGNAKVELNRLEDLREMQKAFGAALRLEKPDFLRHRAILQKKGLIEKRA